MTTTTTPTTSATPLEDAQKSTAELISNMNQMATLSAQTSSIMTTTQFTMKTHDTQVQLANSIKSGTRIQ
jgi:hypothetical protein